MTAHQVLCFESNLPGESQLPHTFFADPGHLWSGEGVIFAVAEVLLGETCNVLSKLFPTPEAALYPFGSTRSMLQVSMLEATRATSATSATKKYIPQIAKIRRENISVILCDILCFANLLCTHRHSLNPLSGQTAQGKTNMSSPFLVLRARPLAKAMELLSFAFCRPSQLPSRQSPCLSAGFLISSLSVHYCLPQILVKCLSNLSSGINSY